MYKIKYKKRCLYNILTNNYCINKKLKNYSLTRNAINFVRGLTGGSKPLNRYFADQFVYFRVFEMEKVGEAAKEATKYHIKESYKDWKGQMVAPTNEIQDKRLCNLRKELIKSTMVIYKIIQKTFS